MKRLKKSLMIFTTMMLSAGFLLGETASAFTWGILDPIIGPDGYDDGNYQENGDAKGFLNIVPPGQDGVVNTIEFAEFQLTGKFPKHFNDQTGMYESLVYEAPGITDSELTKFFKDASFGAKTIERNYSPVTGATIYRDEFGVPHIYGKTREATMFAVGYATAEDRLFLMDVLRHLGRARLSEFLGASEANKQMDLEQLKAAPYKEEELTKQYQELCNSGPEGEQVCRDGEAYSKGVTAYIQKALLDPTLLPAEYPALQQLPTKWKPEDIVAIASVVGGIFGKGGGGEVASGRFLAQLQAKYGEEKGRSMWEDFRSANDKEAPVTTTKAFPYNNHRNIDPKSTAIIDVDTVDQAVEQLEKPEELVIDGPFGPIKLGLPKGMSNALLVSGNYAKAGKPIAVFGPQTGYFTPQLLVEMDVHGPGIDARGVAFAGTNIYVQLGRGKDYAWSATSSSADNVDEWVVKLCEPDGSKPTKDSKHYLYKGECRPMDLFTHRQIAKPTAAGIPEPSLDNIIFENEVQRTVYGPVVARGTVKGEPVAVTLQRSTYGKELTSAIGFKRINDPTFMNDGARTFMKAFDALDYTFNWFYVDEQDIAYKHSGLLPIRHPASDPDLPTWGTGEYDWTGKFLAPEQQPQEINPDRGYIVSWNNKPAPQFRADDANYNWGSIHRSLFLEKRIKKAIKPNANLTRADIVNIVMDAATVDLKGQEVYPHILKILGDTAPGGDRQLQQMRDHLETWVNSGGHRRDFIQKDGKYDHAVAVAIGDEYFKTLVDAIFGDELKDTSLPNTLEDSPQQGQGSAYMTGYYSYVHKVARQVLGTSVRDRWSQHYCGDGTKEDCRTILWDALKVAATNLSNEYGSSNVNDWVYDSARDEIIQTGLGVTAAPNMQWMNRPTFQQVVQVGEE